MSVPHGEREPGAGLDFADETLQRRLINDCVGEALAYATVARTFNTSTPFQLDDALMGLAQATDDPEIANAIAKDEVRLTALADIARRTADSSLEQAVVAQATDLFGNQKDVTPLLSITDALGTPALLSAITDAASRQEAIWRLAIHREDTSLVGEIQDPERRLAALRSIITYTQRDIAPYLALIDDAHERQRAIAARALHKQDLGIAATISNVSLRVSTLLAIAEKSEGKIVATDLPQRIAQVSDDMPVPKAMYLKQYMDISESTEQVHALRAAAGRIEDPAVRAYFLASVVARTGDTQLAAEVEAALQTHGSLLLPHARNSIYAGLARGLGDLRYAYSIYDARLREVTQTAVIIKTRDVQTALELKDANLLRKLVVTYDDVDLAVTMAASPDGSLMMGGEALLLEFALKQKSMDPILRMDKEWRRRPLLVRFLIEQDDIAATEKIEDRWIKKEAQIGIAERRGDIALAQRLGASGVVKAIEDKLLASTTSGGTLSLDEIDLIADPVVRELRYYAHLSEGGAAVKAKIVGAIRERPAGWRYNGLLMLAERTRDPLLAYEALHDMRGAINDTLVILKVSDAICLIKGKKLARE